MEGAKIFISEDERFYLVKWLGKIIDRDDLLEEIDTSKELTTLNHLYTSLCNTVMD